MDIYINKKKFRLPRKFWKDGGEAEIYSIKGFPYVLKIFKTDRHPSFKSKYDKLAAKQKIAEHQSKLIQFPKNLPANIIVAKDMIRNIKGKIIGYTMPFVSNSESLILYSEKNWREQARINNVTMTKILLNLHDSISALHKNNIVIGDLNDLNVLIKKDKCFLIDTDSYQFGKFLSKGFTQTFVDPLVCKANGSELMQNKKHSTLTDWYAFTIMVMKSLMFVGPYDGIYKGKKGGKKLPIFLRPLHRITVFNKKVIYPKFAKDYKYILSDELLNYFYQTFIEDKRGVFPRYLLEDLEWKKCKKCGLYHARPQCPVCSKVLPTTKVKTLEIRGNVTAKLIFETSGHILSAVMQSGKLAWIYHEDDSFKRENKSVFAKGKLQARMKYAIQSETSIIGKAQDMIKFGDKNSERLFVEQYDSYPIFASNTKHIYWGNNGQLLKNGRYGNEYIADIVPDQTLFWVGEKFGFGFYKDAGLQRAFVFDAETKGINDSVKLPILEGRLLDASAVFSNDLCWFFAETIHKGKTKSHCIVINPKGEILDSLVVNKGDLPWLTQLRGKTAIGHHIFASTDEGMVRISLEHGRIIQTRSFPDTEAFVDSHSKLLAGNGGIYVIDSNKITHLIIN